MILPVVAYGDPVLKQVAKEITPDYPNLDALIENMHETMYGASGVGLAAPQIGKSVRLFLVDASPFADDDTLPEAEQEFLKSFKHTFINPVILEESGDEWAFNEGCLSIPNIRESVLRQPEIKIQYFDENFKNFMFFLN